MPPVSPAYEHATKPDYHDNALSVGAEPPAVAPRHDQRAGVVAVVLEKTSSGTARERGSFYSTEIAGYDDWPAWRKHRLTHRWSFRTDKCSLHPQEFASLDRSQAAHTGQQDKGQDSGRPIYDLKVVVKSSSHLSLLWILAVMSASPVESVGEFELDVFRNALRGRP